MADQIARIWNRYFYVYMQGLWGTIWLSAVSVFFATILGTILAMMKLSKYKPLNWFVDLYLWILRGTPALLHLYFFWLILPKMFPALLLTETQSILIALIVSASAYVCEIIRSGIQAVDVGQTEAAKSLGMTTFNTMRKIVLPQAVKNILPALGNEYISMIKQTSLASVFFVGELMTAYRTIQAATFLSIPALTIAGLVYLSVTSVLTVALRAYERRLRRSDKAAE